MALFPRVHYLATFCHLFSDLTLHQIQQGLQRKKRYSVEVSAHSGVVERGSLNFSAAGINVVNQGE